MGLLEDIGRQGVTIVGTKTPYETLSSGQRHWRGVVGEASALAASADASLEHYGLARMVASEVGRGASALYMLLVAEAVRNDAKAAGQTIDHYVRNRTNEQYAFTKGHYGEQKGRKVSSTRDPSERSLAAARAVLGQGTNYAQGAARFYDPRVQDGGVQGTAKLNYDAIGIAEKWSAEGWNWIGPIDGVNSYRLMMLKKFSGKQNPTAWIAAIKEGRGGAESAAPFMAAFASLDKSVLS